MLISHNLFWCIMFTCSQKCWTSSCILLLLFFLLFASSSWKSSMEWNFSRVNCLQVKILVPVFSISESFQASQASSSSWIIGSQPRATFNPTWAFQRISVSNKFVAVLNASKNSSPNKCKKYSRGWESSLHNAVYHLSWSINRRTLYWC